MRNISLIPYVCGAGASTAGAEHGPLYCFDRGLAGALQAEDIPVSWAVDPHLHWAGPYGQAVHAALPPQGSPGRRSIVGWHLEELARNVADALRRGQRAVAIGGDHSIAAGSIAGARMALEPDAVLGVVWVDAHPDLHSYASSDTKTLHGMPMGTLLGLDDSLAVKGCPYPVFAPENVIYAGLRSIDEGEIANAAELGMSLPTMENLRNSGIAATLQSRIAELKERCDHIFLSLDLDGFSDALTPATGTPVPGGFTMEEILPLLRDLIDSHSVPLIDLVEFNPTLPGAEETYRAAMEILRVLLARKSA